MKKRIYYIEDSPKDFYRFRSELRSNQFDIFPSEEDWGNEIQTIKLFLQNANDESKSLVESIFLRYRIDLFIIDIKLFHRDTGGDIIFRGILKTNEQLNNKNYIFLSIAPKEKNSVIHVSQNVRFVPKYAGEHEEVNYEKTAIKLFAEIKELLLLSDNDPMDFIRDIF